MRTETQLVAFCPTQPASAEDLLQLAQKQARRKEFLRKVGVVCAMVEAMEPMIQAAFGPAQPPNDKPLSAAK